jgi:hypothetical protein
VGHICGFEGKSYINCLQEWGSYVWKAQVKLLLLSMDTGYGRPALVHLLLEAGADTSAQNESGKTAAEVAR